MQKRILVVEDDRALARVMRDNLALEGFQVEVVASGNAAVGCARTFVPDLILLDLTLPDRDGLGVCSVLREHGRIPIIIVSARGQKADKLKGLNLGADDYVTKPFEMDELLARVRAVLRRARAVVDRLTLGTVSLDFRTMKATRGETEVHLTHREFEVLRYLAEREGRVVHRDELLREIWGYVDTPTTRSVDHAIARLRKKIERDPPNPDYIRTAHGGGYCLTCRPSGDERAAPGDLSGPEYRRTSPLE